MCGKWMVEARPVLRKVPSVWVALGGEFVEQTWEGPNDTYFGEQLA